MAPLKLGTSIINVQLDADNELDGNFRETFVKALGDTSSQIQGSFLFAHWIDTKLGPMLSISNNNYLYLLEFVKGRRLEKKIEYLKRYLKVAIILGKTAITEQIEQEVKNYFEGTNFVFRTPCFFLGTNFQKAVWSALQAIPSGQTRSYLDIAKAMGKPTAYRALANANGANQLALIVPCHRVINKSGQLGGYAGGINRKAWLINHEQFST